MKQIARRWRRNEAGASRSLVMTLIALALVLAGCVPMPGAEDDEEDDLVAVATAPVERGLIVDTPLETGDSEEDDATPWSLAGRRLGARATRTRTAAHRASGTPSPAATRTSTPTRTLVAMRTPAPTDSPAPTRTSASTRTSIATRTPTADRPPAVASGTPAARRSPTGTASPAGDRASAITGTPAAARPSADTGTATAAHTASDARTPTVATPRSTTESPSETTAQSMTSEADNPPTPEPAGNVVLIAPVPCGVLSVRSAPSAASAQSAELCDPPMLRSGSTKRDEFVALLSFDLRALPAGSEVLYAGLELVGLDDAFLDEVGRWTVRAVALPEHAAMQDLSFARIMAAPAVEPAVAWRLGRAELAPGGRNTLKMDGEGLGFLAGQLGRGSVAFRIEGPLGDTNLFDWEARGPRAPRLRLAYTLSSATATAMPLVVWDATPTAGATQGRGAAAASPTP